MKFCLLVVVFFLSCTHQVSRETPLKTSEYKDTDFLVKEDAEKRKQIVSDIRYTLNINVANPHLDYFSGEVQIDFSLSDISHDLRIDFYEGKILESKINEKNVQVKKEKYYLLILKNDLKVGQNLLVLKYEQAFSKNGSGFYKFFDEEDKRFYFYTDFEPFNAHQLFPCFDQPDLKAQFKLYVTAPNDFKVISAGKLLKFNPGVKHTFFEFSLTPPISTYVFSLHLGEFAEFNDVYKEVPLKIFVRKSFQKYVDPSEWFLITKAGLKYFEEYFDYAYPFKKYDQVLVPDFNSGAMENVAAVTFSEDYFRRGKRSLLERERHANVILHEMAHMWFGNLVTMKWWNGLWLNESFATVMATKALVESTAYKDAWLTFLLKDKTWAVHEDDFSTTHPIEVPINNTDDAFTNFDGITYGKGASALKQLIYYVGDEAFQDGIRLYMKEFSYGNTSLSNFFEQLEKKTDYDLDPWITTWLKTSGVERISSDVSCEDDLIRDFYVQSSNLKNVDDKVHKILVNLIYLDKKNMMRQQYPMLYQVKSNLDEVVGHPCPHLVLLNSEDQTYVKLNYSKNEIEKMGELILRGKLNLMERAQFWVTLNELVLDLELSPSFYISFAMKLFEKEKNLQVFKQILLPLPQFLYYLKGKTIDEKKLIKIKLLAYLTNKKNKDSELLNIVFDQFVAIADEEDDVDNLLALLKLAPDSERLWDLYFKLSSLGHKDIDRLVENELKKDSSGFFKKQKLKVMAAKPVIKNKEKMLLETLSDIYSLSEKQSIWEGIYPRHQEEYKLKNAEFFYTNLQKLLDQNDLVLIESFLAFLTPTICEANTLDNLKEFKVSLKDHALLNKDFQKILEEDERCINIRKKE